jgi:hypothetical protein
VVDQPLPVGTSCAGSRQIIDIVEEQFTAEMRKIAI